MKKTILSLNLMLVFVLLSQAIFAQGRTDIMIQGFNWESHSNTAGWYNIVKTKASDLQSSGVNMIWLPPPSDAAAPQGYLPRELYDVNSEYGTEAELKSLISELHNNNVKAIADIVINHRVGSTDWADFQNPTWDCRAVIANDEWGQNGGNPCGNWDSGDNYHAARDIDHSQGFVQNDITAWMNWLKSDIGFDGWRYDYVRGFWGGYNKIYNDGTNPYFSVGELWDNLDINNPDPHRQQIVDWINATGGTSTAFDFTTKGILQQAVNGELWRLNNNGSAPGVMGWWPAKAVTFVDNHDTGSTQGYWPFPGDKVMQGYAYILTHPGIPTIFWDHFYDWGLHDEIKALAQVRRDNGLHSESVLDIKKAEWNVYAAEIDGKVAMKIGSGNWSPSGSGWNLVASGNDYAVWSKGTPVDTTAPVVSLPASTTFANSTDVTISATDDSGATPTIYYTTDGSTPTTSSASATGSVTLNLTATTTVKAIAVDGSGNTSGVSTATYTRDDTVPAGFKVYFYTTFANPTVYFWRGSATTTWPGESMTNEGNGWYSYEFPNGCTNLIFNDNGASQTADLSRCAEGWYYQNAWHNQNPLGPVGDLTVHFKPNGYSNPEVYFWGLTGNSTQTTTWPGETMTSEGNGWYKYTFTETSCANVIFSNGGASQTADLSICQEGWYTNGSWSYSTPSARIEKADFGLTNYPNPFNGITNIRFNLIETGYVNVTIFDAQGKVVEVLNDGELDAGRHLMMFDGNKLNAGLYFCKMNANGQSLTQKLMIIK